MVAYSFQAMFCPPIVDRIKRQTIRALGARRHAREGEDVQLYRGMRTKHCAKIIPDVRCLGIVAALFDLRKPFKPIIQGRRPAPRIMVA